MTATPCDTADAAQVLRGAAASPLLIAGRTRRMALSTRVAVGQDARRGALIATGHRLAA